MSIAYSGDNITFPDTTTQASAQVGMKNRVIDGGFILNQRVYVSGTSLASGVYGHDRWKGGASGGTYTFTQGALGVNTTITITAGSLIQVIEGCNVAEGGTYVLSWTGTAQGRLNGGTYGASGTVTVTGWTAGTNLNVEFNTGTCGSVQLEKGSTATSFDYRPYGTELALCQRYYFRNTGSLFAMHGSGTVFSTTQADVYTKFPVSMRAIPTVSLSTTQIQVGASNYAATSVSGAAGVTTDGAFSRVVTGGVMVVGYAAVLTNANNASGYLDATAEL